jgi:hypothetical protein
MLKKLLTIPDTFDPDDRRRRQILNILLVAFITLSILNGIVALMLSILMHDAHATILINLSAWATIFFTLLLFANRSPKLPGWLVSSILVAFIIIAIAQVDAPKEL